MTKEELQKALQEVEEQRNQLKEELNKLEGTDETAGDGVVTMATVAKKALHDAVASGNLKNILDKVSSSIDFAKTAVTSFSQIVEKAQAKMDGKIEEITIQGGMTVMSNMWMPMVLGLIQTQEFQHIMANMLVKIIKDA
ncbi:MAG: hypothetical protein PWR06_680 [Thermoanaerobacteraceae bacterium]|jgi:AICAR transformylase/IMP cyclohydrolase PurH|uniref:Uncharacterized protein n=1 Tax=Biomaibacter acetigenes TaxID=2316383 RepID=A0A3G2R3C0_9FIRM|nr:hypothetical protein [Biomaibacter acetigenes]MDK2877964.1 hypothetical protein [Thermoanaerobacteraceae bacterium]RKL64422.1 hypothetical protein DXT63_01610 [Thermoanaerobacteraceae bacterium SP2]AYO29831.1 hypothetical protein D2962_03685 [Biomaibacter acetigenes]MDN5303070.1 hypothetical protein [Thermoanaerobacteraceae bacterium]MDN5313534.1 hypothetical protein [Thermoanaerobacteraceae bacterium]